MLNKVWTISNFLSISRVILLFPIAYSLFSDLPEKRFWVAGLLILCVITDFLDGYLARRLHQVSELGKLIDPLADKIGIGSVVIMLVINGDIPFWFMTVVVLRDLLILAGGLYIKKKKNITPQSNWPGKIAVSVIAVYMLFAVLQMPSLESEKMIALWLSIVMIIISLVSYMQRLFIGVQVQKKESNRCC
ncbi:MAG: CDP-diacylglycerol--glycerol-3-phosphate 3-phosphatidyltransferase [bacterium]